MDASEIEAQDLHNKRMARLAHERKEREDMRADIARLRTERDALRAALQKIADLVDSEAGEPLDDAISIAEKALGDRIPEQGARYCTWCRTEHEGACPSLISGGQSD